MGATLLCTPTPVRQALVTIWFISSFITKGQLYLKLQNTIQEQSRKKQTSNFVFSHMPRNTIPRNLKPGKTPANLATEIGESTPVFPKDYAECYNEVHSLVYVSYQAFHNSPALPWHNPLCKSPNGYTGPQFEHNIYTASLLIETVAGTNPSSIFFLTCR